MMRKKLKQHKAAEEKLSQDETVSYMPWDEDTLYKEAVENQDIVKQVCKKYGLDYDSASMKDVTREMRNYEEALWLLDEMGDKPLLSAKGEGMDSLETYICDIYAFDGGKQVIESYCREHGLDAGSASIKDLTAEDLTAIGENAYHTSDHPKN